MACHIVTLPMVLASVFFIQANAAQAAFSPWDPLVDDSWIYFGPPQDRILMRTVNNGDYELGFDQARSDGSARGLNALKFAQSGVDTGHLVSNVLSGSFQINNSGDNRTFNDLLFLVVVDADLLPPCFSMSLGLQGGTPYEFDPVADFAYYDEPTYDTGRPTGYYSATSPTGEGVCYALETGMVTILAVPGVDLAPETSATFDYGFHCLPGDAMFSVYGFDAAVGWVYHTNRALIDAHRPTSPVSTFTVAPLPGDFDGDGQVDLSDYAHLAECVAGPGRQPDPPDSDADACLVIFDVDHDSDVDLSDCAQFQLAFGE